jgi:hypothetical protein
MAYQEFDSAIGDPLRPGEVIKTRSVTRISKTNAGGEISEHYRTRNKHRFVFLLLGFETDIQLLDVKKALKGMGFVPKKKRP